VTLALSAAAIAAVVTQRQPMTYESSVTLVVQTSAGANDTETLVRTMIALVGSEVVGEALREEVGSPLAADEITSSLAVDRPPGSSVLTIYYYDTDAARSVETAQAVVPVFQEQVSLLEADQAGQLAPNYAIQPWGGGAVVTTDIPAPVLRNAAIAALLGALLGGIGAVIYQQRNPLVRTVEDAARATRLPVVTTPRWLSGRSRTQWHPADAVDAVLTSLPAALGQPTLPRRILVVGTDSGRQRSAFITHLARALEQEGLQPTLVDADLESGRLSRHLGLAGATGLADCLRADLPPKEAITVPASGLAAGLPFLPAGRNLPLRSASAAIAIAIAHLDDPESRLIVDAPVMSGQQSLGPLVRSTDAVILLVDGARATATRTTSLASLVRSLGNAPAVTVLLTDRPEHQPGRTVSEWSGVPAGAVGAAPLPS
jgi:Mrp family chromosome partitioning ATPase